ncbi:hypothetical protein M8818_002677 [Zalaria obscura]|uniref:Uncharacterized protein n=1 Tax=Zalaria obscura TaxID=2024903 RepID=A0ACC3SGK1_9PEZI
MYTIACIVVALSIVLQPSLVRAGSSTGCGKALPAGLKKGGIGQSNKLNFTTSTGAKRTLLLHIPTNYDPNIPAPLVFSFHGRGEDGSQQERLSKLSDESWNPNMLVAYPDSIDNQWQGDPDATGYNDVGFTMDMIAAFEKDYCIDSSRIYSSGFSDGGGFSLNILACDATASTKIAAFSGFSGAYYVQGSSGTNCDPGTVKTPCSAGRQGIPILENHGTADGTINYDGGVRRDLCLPSIPHFVTAWAERNGLGSANVSTVLYNGNATRFQFGASSGEEGLVTHYRVKGLGHDWPTAKNVAGFDGTPLLIEFFNKHTLVSTSPGSTAATTPRASSSASASGIASTHLTTASSINTRTTSTAPLTSTQTTGNLASPICPAATRTLVTDTAGNSFGILCAMDTTGNPIQNAVYTTFGGCIELCGKTAACGHVAYNGACYLKGPVTKMSDSLSVTAVCYA